MPAKTKNCQRIFRLEQNTPPKNMHRGTIYIHQPDFGTGSTDVNLYWLQGASVATKILSANDCLAILNKLAAPGNATRDSELCRTLSALSHYQHTPDPYAASPSAIYIFTHLSPWVFTTGQLFMVASDGYFPVIDPRYTALFTLMLYTVNDQACKHLFEPLLFGSLGNTRNRWALELGISKENANQLFIDIGQTACIEPLKIECTNENGQKQVMTDYYLMNSLDISQIEAMLMLSTKITDKSIQGKWIAIIAKVDVLRQLMNVAIGLLLDTFVLPSINAAMPENRASYLNAMLVFVVCWALKDVFQTLSSKINLDGSPAFYDALIKAHDAHFTAVHDEMGAPGTNSPLREARRHTPPAGNQANVGSFNVGHNELANPDLRPLVVKTSSLIMYQGNMG